MWQHRVKQNALILATFKLTHRISTGFFTAEKMQEEKPRRNTGEKRMNSKGFLLSLTLVSLAHFSSTFLW